MMDVSFSLVDNWSQIHSWKSLGIHEYMSFYLNFVGYDGGSEYSQTWNQETERDAEF